MASTRDSLIDQAEALGFNRDSLRSLTTRNIKEAVRVAQGDRQELNEFVQKFQWGQLNTVRATAGRVEPKNKVIVTPAGAPRPNPTPFWTKPQLPGEGGGDGGTADHPFRLVTRPKPGSETTVVQGGIVYESSLYLSLRPNDKQAITGLLNADRTSGWFDLIGTDAIWLGIVFNSSGAVTSATIDSWGQSDDFEVDEDAWSGNDSYCEDDGDDPPVHQTSRKLIAYTVAGGGGLPVVTQVMFHDQVLRNVCIDGRPARYPFDHEGGYPL